MIQSFTVRYHLLDVFFYMVLSRYFVLFFLCLFRAAPTEYGGFQARGQIRAVTAGLYHQPQPWVIQPISVTYTAAHGNARSLTHWARPVIEPASSWMLVKFVNHWATMGTLQPLKLRFSKILELKKTLFIKILSLSRPGIWGPRKLNNFSKIKKLMSAAVRIRNLILGTCFYEA